MSLCKRRKGCQQISSRSLIPYISRWYIAPAILLSIGSLFSVFGGGGTEGCTQLEIDLDIEMDLSSLDRSAFFLITKSYHHLYNAMLGRGLIDSLCWHFDCLCISESTSVYCSLMLQAKQSNVNTRPQSRVIAPGHTILDTVEACCSLSLVYFLSSSEISVHRACRLCNQPYLKRAQSHLPVPNYLHARCQP